MTDDIDFDTAPEDAIVSATDETSCYSCDFYSVKILATEDGRSQGKCFRDMTDDNRKVWWVDGRMVCPSFRPPALSDKNTPISIGQAIELGDRSENA